MGERKAIKKAVLVCVCLLFAAGFAGCGKKADASACLEARLDNLFKCDTKTVVELSLIRSESMAADAYDEGISAALEAFFSSVTDSGAGSLDFQVSKELKSDFRKTFQEIYASAKYEVGSFTEQADGSCVVTVTCEQLQVFEPALENAVEAYGRMCERWQEEPSSAPQSDGEMAEHFLILFKVSLENALADAKYAQPIEVAVNMTKVAEQCYVLQNQDLAGLKLELFDQLDTGKIPHFYAAGLSGFDAQAYLKAMLDVSYKNDSKEFVKIMGVSAEQAASIYEFGIDSAMQAFLQELDEDIPETLQNDFRELIKETYSKAKYDVKEAQKQEDGSYVVTVSYEQARVYEPMMWKTLECYRARLIEQRDVPAGGVTEKQQILLAMKDAFQKVLSDVEYKEPAETFVTLIPQEDGYIMDANDGNRLSLLLFDTLDAWEMILELQSL